MIHILLDTCVWFDLAKDQRQQMLLAIIEHLVSSKQFTLIVPRVVVDEFNRARTRVIDEGNRGMSSQLKNARDVVSRVADADKKVRLLNELHELEHRLPQLADAAVSSASRIESLLSEAKVIETSDEILRKAALRAVEARAPFHRQKNSMGDAIIIETYADYRAEHSAANVRFAFVTHNIKDFSQVGGDVNLPHPDIAALFSPKKSIYSISLADAVKRVAPGRFGHIEIDENFAQEPRRLPEILDSIEEFSDKVWYNRHMGRLFAIRDGRLKVVNGAYDFKDRTKIAKDIWTGARKAAKRVEKAYGRRNLGPWDDFEWGMINGKLSALRWVLGDDWDMLDT